MGNSYTGNYARMFGDTIRQYSKRNFTTMSALLWTIRLATSYSRRTDCTYAKCSNYVGLKRGLGTSDGFTDEAAGLAISLESRLAGASSIPSVRTPSATIKGDELPGGVVFWRECAALDGNRDRHACAAGREMCAAPLSLAATRAMG